MPDHDAVNHPQHYRSHPSGIECIQITEHMGFCLGNAVKYIWRADLKGNAIEDLEKAAWYIRREIERRKALDAAHAPRSHAEPPPAASAAAGARGVAARGETGVAKEIGHDGGTDRP